jgi:hypothetical protein
MTNKKLIPLALMATVLTFLLSYQTSFAQYNYGTPSTPAPAASAPSSANMQQSPTMAPAQSTNPGNTNNNTLSDPGSVGVPNTGAGGEAPQNWLTIIASTILLFFGLKVVRDERRYN